jgi:hypothetical protein
VRRLRISGEPRLHSPKKLGGCRWAAQWNREASVLIGSASRDPTRHNRPKRPCAVEHERQWMVQRKADAVRIWIRNRDLKSRSRRLLQPKRPVGHFHSRPRRNRDREAHRSFWRSCSEFRNTNIGRWLLDRGLAPWPKGPRDLGRQQSADRAPTVGAAPAAMHQHDSCHDSHCACGPRPLSAGHQ